MANSKLKMMAKKAGVAQWQIAIALEMSEASLTRLFRKELTPEKRDEIIEIIKKIKTKRDAEFEGCEADAENV